MVVAEFSQKNDVVLVGLLQAMLDLNRHINSHGEKSADSEQKAPAEIDGGFRFSLYEQRRSKTYVLQKH